MHFFLTIVLVLFSTLFVLAIIRFGVRVGGELILLLDALFRSFDS